MLLPEVTTLSSPAAERVNAGGRHTPRGLSAHSRRAALFALGRFVRIPLICATIVALTSPELEGRVIALTIALVVTAAGVALHARELFPRLAGH